MFDLHELAEWAADWVPAPVTLEDVSFAGCSNLGIRLFKEGEIVSEAPVSCACLSTGGRRSSD